MEILDTIATIIYKLYWPTIQLLILLFLIVNWKGMGQAMKGGNGKWQMSEISQLVIIGILLYMTYVEANRTESWHKFDVAVFVIFVCGLFFMAKMQEALQFAMYMVKSLQGMFKFNKNEKDTTSNSAGNLPSTGLRPNQEATKSQPGSEEA